MSVADNVCLRNDCQLSAVLCSAFVDGCGVAWATCRRHSRICTFFQRHHNHFYTNTLSNLYLKLLGSVFPFKLDVVERRNLSPCLLLPIFFFPTESHDLIRFRPAHFCSVVALRRTPAILSTGSVASIHPSHPLDVCGLLGRLLSNCIVLLPL